MLEEATDFLACPKCKSLLELTINKKIKQEIITGSLICKNVPCKKRFEIINGIPNFLL